MRLRTKLGLAAATLVVIAAFDRIRLAGDIDGDEGITSHNWTCPALVQPIIDMSKGKDVEILELSQVRDGGNIPGLEITCYASAETNAGRTPLQFGAHVSDGGQIMLEYKQTGLD